MQAETERLTVAEHEAIMQQYVREGTERAAAVGNRGPLRLDDSGRLHPDILAAYWQHGFYVFENVLEESEISELRRDVDYMLERAPVGSDSTVDAQGQPALGIGAKRDVFSFSRPLADAFSKSQADRMDGARASSTRAPDKILGKMSEPIPSDDACKEVVIIVHGSFQFIESGLRLYGHPKLLAVAQTINGPDFVPQNDATFVKQPGLGASVAWHQDGVTHWNSPDLDEGTHGVNFQCHLCPTSGHSCLWVVPETHRSRVDIPALVADAGGSDRLREAIPLYCNPGDVTIVNRQTLHGSFANTSSELRIAVSFGFHRRRSVLGQHGVLLQPPEVVYDEDFIFKRSAVVQVAIDARHQYYPNETPFVFQPFIGLEDQYRWNDDDTYERVIRDYHGRDVFI